MDINSVLGSIGGVIDWTYDKTMEVWGWVNITKPNGATGSELGIVASNIRCRVSRNTRDNIQPIEGQNLNTNSHIIFCSPDIEIKAGSQLKIDGVKYQSTEEAMTYPSHQEIKVNKYEWV